MKNIIFLFATMLVSYSCAGQLTTKNYVLSFPFELKDSVLNSARLIQGKDTMTRQEALKYVYNNDTSKLTCKGVYYNMETEKVTGKWEELKLPKKCMGIKTDSFYLVAFTSYECQDPKARQWNFLNLAIYDRQFNLKDTLIIYKGDEYDDNINSLINANSCRIFLFKLNEVSKTKDFSILRINPKTLRFETIKIVQVESINTDYLLKALVKLGLSDIFYK